MHPINDDTHPRSAVKRLLAKLKSRSLAETEELDPQTRHLLDAISQKEHREIIRQIVIHAFLFLIFRFLEA